MASFPTSVKSWTALVDGTDYPQAAQLNEARDEINAIEAGYLNGTARLNSSHSTVASLSVVGGSTLSGEVRAPNQVRCNAYSTGTQTVSSNSTGVLTLDVEDFDVGSMHSTGTNPSRLTVPAGASGTYFLHGRTLFSTLGGLTADFHILKNGARLLSDRVLGNSSHAVSAELSAVAVLDAADYVELEVWSPTTAAVTVGNTSPFFASRLLAVRMW